MQALNWLIQRITGAVLLAGLTVHFMVMHFSGAENLAHAEVVKRLSSPIWLAFNAAFLLSAIYHGMSGLWGMTVEYLRHKGALLKIAKATIAILSVGLAGAGFYILSFGM